MVTLQSTVLLEGCAKGPLLHLSDDISFWGGVDPLSGVIIDQRHPQYGESVAGKVLAMHRSIGSSSGSSVLLELFRRKLAPLGIILVEADLVVALGVVVAREMEFGDIPLVRVHPSELSELSGIVSINSLGEICSCGTSAGLKA